MLVSVIRSYLCSLVISAASNAKSGIHCQGRAGEEGGGADPAPMVNVLWA